MAEADAGVRRRANRAVAVAVNVVEERDEGSILCDVMRYSHVKATRRRRRSRRSRRDRVLLLRMEWPELLMQALSIVTGAVGQQ